MDTLLDALQQGRLIELPDNDKFDSLQFLSHIIEAIPSVPNGTDVEGMILQREKNIVTALGNGFACPHARVPYDEDLICSVGWSPSGIDYGASDNIPVHVLIMYLVPDNQRNHYLKEVSALAKAIMNTPNSVNTIRSLKDLNAVRNYLLDLVSFSKTIVGSETRARMIQLEARETPALSKVVQLSNMQIEPISIVVGSNKNHIVLSQNREVADALEGSQDLIDSIANNGVYETNGWRVIKRSSSVFQLNRTIYDCIAFKNVSGNTTN